MNFSKIITIYKKELLDLMRDRRTIITAIVLPIILYPLIMIGFSAMMSRQEMKLEQQTMVIYVNDNIADETSQMIIDSFNEIETIQIMGKAGIYEEETYLSLLGENSIQAVIDIKDSLSAAGYRVFNISVFYNQTNEKSIRTYEKITNKLYDIEDDLVGERLKKININEEILNAVEIKKENIAPPEQMIGFMVGKFLPYLLIILTISAASVVASDLVAGEKERGTLETILVSAARRNELVIGKYLTIITISIMTVVLNLFSMYLSFQHIFRQARGDFGDLQLPLGNFALILFLMLPLITLFAAILLSISTYSRNIKESQSYQMPLLFGAIMLSMVSFLPGFELNLGFALIPIVNFSLMMRDIMLGNYQIQYIFIIVGYTILLDIIMISISIKLFNNESVLFRTSEEKSLKFWGKEKKNVFSTQFVIIFFIVILLALFYIGGTWQVKNLPNGLLKTELLLILLPSILVLRISKSDIKKTLRMNASTPVNFLIVALMAIPVFILAILSMQVINTIFPIPESYIESMSKIIYMGDISFFKVLFIIAVIPGICEEIMFRGYIINAFTKHGFWKAITITAILFGAFHLDPFRMFPATLLGFWMGYLLLKTNSILLPMFAHFLNNASALVLGRFGEEIPVIKNIISSQDFPFWIGIPAIIVLTLLLKTFIRINENNHENFLRS